MLFYSEEAHWKGPTSKIWGDDQCTSLENLYGHIGECKQACGEKAGCNAFNYKTVGSTGCSLRKCSMPVPYPSWSYANYKGYYLATGKNKLMRYHKTV